MAEWYTRQTKANLAMHIVKQESDLAAARAEIERLTKERQAFKGMAKDNYDRLQKAETERDEARAQVSASWIAGHAVGAGKGGCGLPCGYDCNGACFAPPTLA